MKNNKRLPLGLIIILIIFASLTLYQAVILPIGEADDETDHYHYLRFVARNGHPPFTEAERQEAGFKGGLAPLYYWLVAWPIAIIGEDTPPDIRRVDARSQRHIANDGLGINHVMHTLDEAWPWRGQTLAWHLIRFFSLFMGAVTISATYALARQLYPEAKLIALSAAAFVAFLPRFVISSAVINDDNLVFALTALLLWVQVILLQRAGGQGSRGAKEQGGRGAREQGVVPLLSEGTRGGISTGRLMAILGVLFGLSLITKYFSLILIPEVVFTLWFMLRQTRHSLSSTAQDTPRPATTALHFTLYALLPFLSTLFLTAGPWFSFIIYRFNRIERLGFIPGLAASLGEPQITEGLISLLSGQSVRPVAATYALPEWFSLLYRSFWFEYGWMQVFAPNWVYSLFTIFAGFVIIGLITTLMRSKQNNLPQPDAPSSKQNHPPQPDTPPTTQNNKTLIRRLAQHTKQTLRPTHYALRTTHHALRTISPLTWLFTLHLLLFASVLIMRYILSATIDTGQGRHLYPALPVIALLAALGLHHFRLWIPTLWVLTLNGSTILSLVERLNLDLTRWTNSINPIIKNQLTANRYLLSAISGFLLPAAFFLIPAAASLLPAINLQSSSAKVQHAPFILPHYPTIPSSAMPILLPVEQRQSIEFDNRLWLVGFEANKTAIAGEALPVRLYWFAEQEAKQDYLLALCLQDDKTQPVACWQGHFEDGFYPARAWEKGDTLAHTIFIPIPTCYQLKEQSYSLKLEIWPLDLTTATPLAGGTPLLQHTFVKPEITIQPSITTQTVRPTVELWQNKQRLNQNIDLQLYQSLTQIRYTNADNAPAPKFHRVNKSVKQQSVWEAQSKTVLYLPCEEEPTPFAQAAHFIVNPTLTSGTYQSQSKVDLPQINLLLRDRIVAPITATLSFSNTLSPIALQLPNQPPINLHTEAQKPSPASIPAYQLPLTHLPLTIRWHTQRWTNKPLIVALKLLSQDFAIGGERVTTLGNRYPNVLWIPTEVVEESYALQIKPDTPPGLYVFEISLLYQDEVLHDSFAYLPLIHNGTQLGNNLYPATIRLLDPAHNDSPKHTVHAQLGQDIELSGYDIDPQRPTLQAPIFLTLYWQSKAQIPHSYTVFTQLLGPDGQVAAQWDNPPQGGRYPTTEWTKNDTIVDRYTLTLQEGAIPGDYRLLVGMYDPVTGERLPLTVDGQAQANNALELTTLTIDN